MDIKFKFLNLIVVSGNGRYIFYNIFLAVIDRFYAINEQIHVPKKSVLIMTYADTSAKEAKPIINHYETLLNYLGWSDAGQIIASGLWPAGAVNGTEYINQAYNLGKSFN